MTAKDRALQIVGALPADVTLEQIIVALLHLETEETGNLSREPELALPGGGVWNLLEHAAGTVEMPTDWTSEHDHCWYGTPKRTSAA